MTVKEETRKLTLRQREGRAINAVAELLRRKLSVPNIYLEPPPSLIKADVLAVDRGGSGDLHGVEIKLPPDLTSGLDRLDLDLDPTEFDERLKLLTPKTRQRLREIHRQVMSIPAHYRYLAIPEKSFNLAIGDLLRFGLFSKDGIGRLGVITIKENDDGMPTAELVEVPERFRVDSTRLSAIETKLLAKSRPDIEVRI